MHLLILLLHFWLDTVAATAADSDCTDDGEILPIIEDFKATQLPQKGLRRVLLKHFNAVLQA